MTVTQGPAADLVVFLVMEFDASPTKTTLPLPCLVVTSHGRFVRLQASHGLDPLHYAGQ